MRSRMMRHHRRYTNETTRIRRPSGARDRSPINWTT